VSRKIFSDWGKKEKTGMYSHTAQSTSGELNQNNKGVKKKREKSKSM